MTDPTAATRPRRMARIAGAFYLVTIVGGTLAFSLRSGMIVRGDAAATTANIMASEVLYRWANVAEIIGTAAYVGVTAVLYHLLRPVNRTVSLLAAFFSVIGCALGAVASALLFTPLIFLDGSPYLAAFRPDQLQALAMVAIRLQGHVYTLGMICFGFYCLLLGYLVFRSTFLPRPVGVLLALAGLAWLTDSFATLLSPPLAHAIGNAMMIPGFLGEASLTVWLLAVGLNVAQWQRQAGAAASPS
ncbi:MAG: hypothetical protein JWQ29_891 [Phenylobacterium sp.]|nr:hypothetical protein [Phenylobacterium sp.]